MIALGARTLREALEACVIALPAPECPSHLCFSISPLSDPLDFFALVPALEGERCALLEEELGRNVVGVGVTDLHFVEGPPEKGAVRRLLLNPEKAKKCVPMIGGLRFDVQRSSDALWSPFGVARFVRPRLSVVQCNVTAELHLDAPSTLSERQALSAALGKQLAAKSTSTVLTPFLSSQQDFVEDVPSHARWIELVKSAKTQFHDENDSLNKVVLARRQAFPFVHQADPVAVLRGLRDKSGPGTAFLLQPQSDRAFVGVTPELLARRDGKTLFSEALAGTRPAHADETEDRNAQQQLLQSRKDRNEHQFVLRFIVEKLKDSGLQNIVAGNVRLKNLRRLHHLHAQVTAEMGDEDVFVDVLSALHPTPAVAGTPQHKALQWLQTHEGFDRGLYAGAVGRLGEAQDALYVGIRSVLLAGNTAYTFAGAGLVGDSDPNQEWNEVNVKGRGAESVLDVVADGASHAA